MSNITKMVDEFGLIKAQIAELEKQLKPLKEQFAALGQGAYEGELYDVTVSEYDQDTLDMEAVRAKLSIQFMRVHTKTTHVTKVQAKARTVRRTQ